jgi:hypothetical protein
MMFMCFHLIKISHYLHKRGHQVWGGILLQSFEFSSLLLSKVLISSYLNQFELNLTLELVDDTRTH